MATPWGGRGVGNVPGFGRPAEGLGASGLLAAHEASAVAQGAVEVHVGLERVGVLEDSPAVPADVALLAWKEQVISLMNR